MKQKIILITGFFLALYSCSRKSDTVANPPDPNPSGPSVETNAPNTNYRPAFAGQTRIAARTTTARYRADVIATSLTSPWGITVC
jgi:aldose sugar dehydrogenase